MLQRLLGGRSRALGQRSMKEARKRTTSARPATRIALYRRKDTAHEPPAVRSAFARLDRRLSTDPDRRLVGLPEQEEAGSLLLCEDAKFGESAARDVASVFLTDLRRDLGLIDDQEPRRRATGRRGERRLRLGALG